MSSEPQLGGVVLCRVGQHRLAFPAQQVVTIEAYESSGQHYPLAHRAYALPSVQTGRALMGEAGDAVVVDALEVHQETLRLLPAPLLMRSAVGGSLQGFARVQEHLWPVLRLSGEGNGILSQRSQVD